MSKKVAIQGYAASFHDVAARKLFGQDIEIIGCDTFAQVFLCVCSGKADVWRWHDPTKAAIASRAAANLYDLYVLAASIENDSSNATTFVSFERAY